MAIRQRLFKNEYLIGIYSPLTDGETLLALVDNAHEFADLMKIKYAQAHHTLCKLFKKEINFIRFFGLNCTVEFIKEEE